VSDYVNAEDFPAFVRVRRLAMHNQAFELCRNWHDAEDLTQAALLAVYLRWGHLEQRDELAGYARAVLRNAFLAERRRLRWTSEVCREALPEQCIQDGTRALDDRVTVESAMIRLRPGQRVVLRLRFWEDLSVEQTAAVLGCSPGTVTSRTHRAIGVLRSLLAST
jgi:RNA polymerase sigma-70 factor (sigma-E family)